MPTYDTPKADILLLGKTSKSGTRKGYLLSPHLFNTVLQVLATEIRQEEIKGIQIRMEKVNLSLFADGMILYSVILKDSIKKVPELINEFSTVAGYKINLQK